MITITKKAEDMLELLNNEKKLFVRVQILAGGCSGYQYHLSYENESKPNDTVVDLDNGLKVLVDFKSGIFLEGTTIDYDNGLNGTGFKYLNPQEKTSCGCGTSFSV